MSNDITFTTATFGGFEKKQVLDYISSMHAEFEQTKQEHKKKLEEIAAAFRNLEHRAFVAEKKAIQLQEQALLAQNKLQDSNQIITAQKTEIEQLRQKLAQYENTTTRRKAQPANTQRATPLAPTTQPTTPLAAEAKSIAESPVQIGRVILDAHNKADDIITAAQKEANRLIARAQDTIEQQQIKINGIVADYQKRLKAEAYEKRKTAEQQAEAMLQKAQEESKKLMEQIDAAAQKTLMQIEHLRSGIDELTSSTDENIQQLQANSSKQLLPYKDIEEKIPGDDFLELTLPEITLSEPSNPLQTKPVYTDPPHSPESPVVLGGIANTNMVFEPNEEDLLWSTLTFPSLDPPNLKAE